MKPKRWVAPPKAVPRESDRAIVQRYLPYKLYANTVTIQLLEQALAIREKATKGPIVTGIDTGKIPRWTSS